MTGTDLINFYCTNCELSWDAWGTWTGMGFMPERPDADRCPNCMNRGRPHEKEKLS